MRRGMDDIVHVAQRQVQAVAVAHIADEIAQEGIFLLAEFLLHLVLLEFVAAEDDQARGLYCAITVLRKCLPKEPVPPVTSTDLSLRSSQGWEKSRKHRRGAGWPARLVRAAGLRAIAKADGSYIVNAIDRRPVWDKLSRALVKQ